MNQELILVNELDEEIGYGEKMQVHRDANLHRAFSIFVLNDHDELLLQRRALEKYHSGGLWTNTCCSHPVRGEEQEATVHRRLIEEMGFDCDVKPLFSFIYHAELDNELTEHELDHVYLGKFNGSPNPNPEEVCDWKWIDLDKLRSDLKENPSNYTYWLNHAYEQFYNYIKNK